QAVSQRRQGVHTLQPLLIAAQMRESSWRIGRHKQVSSLERGTLEIALHQSDGDHFGVAKFRLGIVRLPPLSEFRVRFQEVIKKAVDISQLVNYALFQCRPPERGKLLDIQLLQRTSEDDYLCFSTQYWGYVMSDEFSAERDRRSAERIHPSP